MTLNDFKQWLEHYGDAWRARDPAAVVRLFSADARYREHPFETPLTGTEAIRAYWTRGPQQSQTDVWFEAHPLAFNANIGFAHWQAHFRRRASAQLVELDGILMATFNDAHLCVDFREWWHRRQDHDKNQP